MSSFPIFAMYTVNLWAETNSIFFFRGFFLWNRPATDLGLELFEVQDWSDVSLNQLRKVEILKVSGTKPERELIKLLLAMPSVLERMLIDKGLRILKELIKFRHASLSLSENQRKIKFSRWIMS